jgi:hypothetical protein
MRLCLPAGWGGSPLAKRRIVWLNLERDPQHAR